MLTIFLLSLIGVPLTGGLLRQVLYLQSGARSRPGLADGAGPAEQRGGGLLLPAHPGDDVHARADIRRAMACSRLSAGLKTALLASAVATVLLGVFPSLVLDFAGKFCYACEVVLSRRSFALSRRSALPPRRVEERSRPVSMATLMSPMKPGTPSPSLISPPSRSPGTSGSTIRRPLSSPIPMNRGSMRSRRIGYDLRDRYRKVHGSRGTSKSDLSISMRLADRSPLGSRAHVL